MRQAHRRVGGMAWTMRWAEFAQFQAPRGCGRYFFYQRIQHTAGQGFQQVVRRAAAYFDHDLRHGAVVDGIGEPVGFFRSAQLSVDLHVNFEPARGTALGGGGAVPSLESDLRQNNCSQIRAPMIQLPRRRLPCASFS